MESPLHILHLEDDPHDAAIVQSVLQTGGITCAITRVQNRAGFLAALENGFRRAYGTIIDSNATAFLAHVMLFVFGNGPVRGFAVTITVGIVTTLFTATMLARLMVSRWYVSARPQELPV